MAIVAGLALPWGAVAQLNQTCTVSALNRTAPVNADGSWVLPNVPSTVGQLRVRATCVENGVTRSGQSEFFALPTSNVLRVADISFDVVEPVPATLDLTAPAEALTAAGETLQLAAAVTRPDGSTLDVTAGATGTNYTVSNPRIATVSADGVVTAVTSGTVLVSAANEGALGVLSLRVVLSGDSDGDGIPDDFEIAVGLDPNNPADALGDLDDDGLANGEEFAAGLDLRNVDTDGDRLRDGEEGGYGTNPLLFDTDGDRVSDGLEILAASNPLDPNSANLAPILEALTVRPASFTLIYNTAVGEASRRLDVTARLIDGTELEARARRYGTTYESSDLTIASFGAEDGVIFAGRDGTATVTARIGSFSGAAEVHVETFSPAALAFLPLSGFPNGVDVSGNHAYVASGGAGLHVIDVSDLAAPARIATLALPGNANDVRVVDGYAYVAAGASGLQIVDVLDPNNPSLIGGVDTSGNATDVAVLDGVVYVADGPAGLQVIDAAVPAAPVRVGGVDTPGNARGVDVVDGLAVVADDFGGVHVIGVSNPGSPVLLGSTHTRGTRSQAASVAVRDRLAYVAEGNGNLGGLRVINFRNPSTPVVAGASTDAFGLSSVALDGSFAVCADYYYANAVPVFDIGATPPRFTAVLDFYRAPSRRDDNGNGIAVRGDGVLFMVGTLWEIRDNGSWGNGGLHIGRYRLAGDDLGVAPEVTLTAPADGASALERSSVTLRATATDDVRVESVQFLIDGQPGPRVYKAPYEATFRVSAGVSSVRIGAVAADLGGNRGTAEEVTLNVVPDDKPTVALLAPAPGLRIVEGATIGVAAEATDDVQVTSVDLRVNGVSRRVATAPPYRVDVPVAVGATQITVEAVATDSAGQTATTGPITFAVEDDPPPVVAIAAPASGTEVTQGATIRVTAAAADDIGVANVRLLINGQQTPSDSLAPYEFNVRVPSGTQLRLSAVATDTVGQTATAAEVLLVVVPDPGTTVVGSVVLEDGQPVADADVICRGVSGQSGADGTFTLAAVPTVAPIICSATATDAEGTPLLGGSATVAPVLGGITEVGPITIAESLFVTDLGTNTNLGDDQAVLVNLPFPFPFMGQTYSQVFLNTNGNLTFGRGSTDWTERGFEFVTGVRDIGLTGVGPAVAVFWDDLLPLISSASAGEPADYYRFTGAAGDQIVAEVSAQREGSSMDSFLTLYNALGTALVSNDDTVGLDSRIAFTLPAAGTYYLRVVELDGLGGANFFYHLSLSSGGAPPRDVSEVEPNDTAASAMPLAYGDRVAGVISLAAADSARNLYFNNQLPGRFVVTWNRVPEYRLGGSNTAQLALFENGRIQMGYNGVTSDDALVGISPSANGPAEEVDLSADTPLSVGPGVAVFEEFDGPVGPDGTNEDPPGTRPFDLDGRVLVFEPNPAGGYDVRVTGAPRTVTATALAVTKAVEGVEVTSGRVEGAVMLEGRGPLVGLEVVVSSSALPGWEARAMTDAKGRFFVEGVPSGGVNAAVYLDGEMSAHAADVLADGGHLVLELRPASFKPKS